MKGEGGYDLYVNQGKEIIKKAQIIIHLFKNFCNWMSWRLPSNLLNKQHQIPKL